MEVDEACTRLSWKPNSLLSGHHLGTPQFCWGNHMLLKLAAEEECKVSIWLSDLNQRDTLLLQICASRGYL